MKRLTLIGLTVLVGCGAHVRELDNGMTIISAGIDKQISVAAKPGTKAIVCHLSALDVVFNRTKQGAASGGYSGVGAQLSGATADEAVELTGRSETITFLRSCLDSLCLFAMAGKLTNQEIALGLNTIIQAAIAFEQRKTVEAIGESSTPQRELIEDLLVPAPTPLPESTPEVPQ